MTVQKKIKLCKKKRYNNDFDLMIINVILPVLMEKFAVILLNQEATTYRKNCWMQLIETNFHFCPCLLFLALLYSFNIKRGSIFNTFQIYLFWAT